MNNPKLLDLKKRCYFLKLSNLDKVGDGSRYDSWGTTRPYLEEFLLFCFNYFKIVIVWSAGKKNYVDSIIDHIFKNLRKPHLVWSYDNIDLDDEVKIGKPITKLLNSDFIYKHHLHPLKTIVLDDNENTFEKNKKNAIHIPPYEPELNIANLTEPDEKLLNIKYWLLLPHVINANDVTKLDMNNIFKYPYTTYIDIANSYND